MMKRTHFIIGVAVTAPFIIYNPVSVIGLIGSYAPDFDIKLKIPHRTITHSLLALVVTTAVIFALDPYIAFVWFINYLLHLLADSLTKMGVPFLYPFKKKKYGLKLFKTGKGGDYLFQFLSVAYIYLAYLK